MKRGKVYLVGAGPGDPGLLTLKGRDLIAAADCVIYDYLVNPKILEHAAPRAELIYVGKRGVESSWTQAEINRLLIEKADEHSIIVRLKGGDPFIFGRGGEEAEVLVDAGIEWEVVPGVTAGSSVAAYAGIPITHRGLSSSVAFVTGHEDPSKPQSAIRWESLATGVDTLVFFMGVSRIGEIADQLLQYGRSSDTPVAVIRWGTYDHQETYISTLAQVADLVGRERITAPALIVVGDVVRMREKLQSIKELKNLSLADYSLPNPFFEALAG
ncbi:MAG: uroporphyrinogen-III C-methyltransferase [Acidobacteria bacterium]|nr:uroporphyrinogen-III C-methyltransferase [Acidobacteriota bacterium]